MEPLLRMALAESSERREGSERILAGLSELMFVEVVRLHVASLGDGHKGWLAGLRDDIVGRALSRLHERPADPWTLDDLSRAAAASRSVLAERFTELIGIPPMQYLAQWRMQMAASLLARGEENVAAIAARVGNESEAAFSRAFKRLVGVAPGTWRRRRAVAAFAEPTPPATRGGASHARGA